jgi:hypothetical protein
MKRKSILFTSLLLLICTSRMVSAQNSQREESLRYFDEAAKVFQHPRCLNCHPAGDAPSQGADMHPHLMNVQRGTDDHGAVGMKCSACHGSENNRSSGVPGAPHWKLAPKEMAWVGLSKGDLCRKLKDPTKPHVMAGGMTKEAFIKHNAEDKLVAWGWKPGDGREPAPLTQKKFGEIVAKWINSGAACPD